MMGKKRHASYGYPSPERKSRSRHKHKHRDKKRSWKYISESSDSSYSSVSPVRSRSQLNRKHKEKKSVRYYESRDVSNESTSPERRRSESKLIRREQKYRKYDHIASDDSDLSTSQRKPRLEHRGNVSQLSSSETSDRSTSPAKSPVFHKRNKRRKKSRRDYKSSSYPYRGSTSNERWENNQKSKKKKSRTDDIHSSDLSDLSPEASKSKVKKRQLKKSSRSRWRKDSESTDSSSDYAEITKTRKESKSQKWHSSRHRSPLDRHNRSQGDMNDKYDRDEGSFFRHCSPVVGSSNNPGENIGVKPVLCDESGISPSDDTTYTSRVDTLNRLEETVQDTKTVYKVNDNRNKMCNTHAKELYFNTVIDKLNRSKNIPSSSVKGVMTRERPSASQYMSKLAMETGSKIDLSIEYELPTKSCVEKSEHNRDKESHKKTHLRRNSDASAKKKLDNVHFDSPGVPGDRNKNSCHDGGVQVEVDTRHHKAAATVTCPYDCGQLFADTEVLKAHLEQVHFLVRETAPNFPCHMCTFQTTDPKLFTNHFMHMHQSSLRIIDGEEVPDLSIVSAFKGVNPLTWSKFAGLLKAENLMELETPGNGYCFISSLLVGLAEQGINKTFDNLSIEIMAEVNRYYGTTYPDESDSHKEEFNKKCANFFQAGDYTNENADVCIGTAANALGVNLAIFQKTGNNVTLLKFNCEKFKAKFTVCLMFHNKKKCKKNTDSHYNALINKDFFKRNEQACRSRIIVTNTTEDQWRMKETEAVQQHSRNEDCTASTSRDNNKSIASMLSELYEGAESDNPTYVNVRLLHSDWQNFFTECFLFDVNYDMGVPAILRLKEKAFKGMFNVKERTEKGEKRAYTTGAERAQYVAGIGTRNSRYTERDLKQANNKELRVKYLNAMRSRRYRLNQKMERNNECISDKSREQNEEESINGNSISLVPNHRRITRKKPNKTAQKGDDKLKNCNKAGRVRYMASKGNNGIGNVHATKEKHGSPHSQRSGKRRSCRPQKESDYDDYNSKYSPPGKDVPSAVVDRGAENADSDMPHKRSCNKVSNKCFDKEELPSQIHRDDLSSSVNLEKCKASNSTHGVNELGSYIEVVVDSNLPTKCDSKGLCENYENNCKERNVNDKLCSMEIAPQVDQQNSEELPSPSDTITENIVVYEVKTAESSSSKHVLSNSNYRDEIGDISKGKNVVVEVKPGCDASNSTVKAVERKSRNETGDSTNSEDVLSEVTDSNNIADSGEDTNNKDFLSEVKIRDDTREAVLAEVKARDSKTIDCDTSNMFIGKEVSCRDLRKEKFQKQSTNGNIRNWLCPKMHEKLDPVSDICIKTCGNSNCEDAVNVINDRNAEVVNCDSPKKCSSTDVCGQPDKKSYSLRGIRDELTATDKIHVNTTDDSKGKVVVAEVPANGEDLVDSDKAEKSIDLGNECNSSDLLSSDQKKKNSDSRLRDFECDGDTLNDQYLLEMVEKIEKEDNSTMQTHMSRDTCMTFVTASDKYLNKSPSEYPREDSVNSDESEGNISAKIDTLISRIDSPPKQDYHSDERLSPEIPFQPTVGRSCEQGMSRCEFSVVNNDSTSNSKMPEMHVVKDNEKLNITKFKSMGENNSSSPTRKSVQIICEAEGESGESSNSKHVLSEEQTGDLSPDSNYYRDQTQNRERIAEIGPGGNDLLQSNSARDSSEKVEAADTEAQIANSCSDSNSDSDDSEKIENFYRMHRKKE